MKARTALCSFCRKSPQHVGPLVEGPNGVYICGDCIELCQSIVAQERRRRSGHESSRFPSPIAIRGRLDECVDGQDVAKEALVAAAIGHHAEPLGEPSSSVLLLGPSASTKVALVRALAHILEVPFTELNVDSLGAELLQAYDHRTDQMSVELLQNTDFDMESSRRTIVFVDAVEQRSVQDALLRQWDSTANASAAEFRIAARELLFVCGADSRDNEALGQPRSADDLIALGWDAEFVRKFGAIVGVTSLDERSLRRLVEAVDFGKLSPLWETLRPR
jgi:hypothetical protein